MPADQLLAQPALRLDRERPVERRAARQPLLAFDARGPADRAGKQRSSANSCVDARRTATRLELVEQRVIERGAERRGLGLADAAHDVQHFGEGRQQRLEVGVLLGRTPGQFAGRRRRACAPRPGRPAARFRAPRTGASRAGWPAASGSSAALPLLRPRQQVGHVGRGDHLVGDDAQGRELVGAILAGAVRHHGRAVPVQDRPRRDRRRSAARSGARARHRDRWRSCASLCWPSCGRRSRAGPVLPVIGEIDAGQRQGDQEPGDGVLKMVVGNVEARLAAHRQRRRDWASRRLRGRRCRAWDRAAPPAILRISGTSTWNQTFLSGTFSGANCRRSWLRRTMPASSTRPAGWPSARRGRILPLLGIQPRSNRTMRPSSVLSGTTTCRPTLFLRLRAARKNSLSFRNVPPTLHAPVLVAQRIAAQQLVERDRRGRLVGGDAIEDVALPFAALHLPDAEPQREDQDRQRDERGPQGGPAAGS